LNKFSIIVPVYNSEKWIGKCIESILDQDYPLYDLLVIDDCSTDRTWDIINSYKVMAYRNQKRIGALANIVEGIEFLIDGIIVTVDGDDYLANNSVLSYLDSFYTRDVWMTYGSFLPLSGKYKNTCQPFNKIMTPCEAGYLVEKSVTPETYRKSGFWVTSHLRTFRKELWDKIDKEDLKENGEFYKVAWDLAFMYPMIEMSGEHTRFIPKVLYMYNDLNPNCDGTLNPQEQVRVGERIRQKKEYARINGDLF